ncbi:MAG TPA: PEP-CTERM sorting domain-containing protein [Woeseiaceae bacterium]
MKIRRVWQGLLFTAFTFTGLAANASLILTLDDGVNAPVTVAGEDSVQFNGAVGTWLFNLTAGLTNPYIGSDLVDALDLFSANVSGGSGTLEITLTRTGMDKSPANWLTYLGGTTDGLIDFALLLNGVAISEYSTTAPNFSHADSGQIDAVDPYSLSLVATLHHDSPGAVSSFDYIVKVPEPSTLALLGSGLLLTGFGVMRRRSPARA